MVEEITKKGIHFWLIAIKVTYHMIQKQKQLYTDTKQTSFLLDYIYIYPQIEKDAEVIWV